MPKKYSEVRELYLAALEKPESQRESFLQAATASSETIKQVRELLGHSSTNTILEVRAPSETQRLSSLNLKPFLKLLSPFASTRGRRWATGAVLLAILAAGGQAMRSRLHTLAVDQGMSAIEALQESISSATLDQLTEWKGTVEATVSPGLGRDAAVAAIRNPDAANLAAFHKYAAQLLDPSRFAHYALFNAKGLLLAIDGKPTERSMATPYGKQMFALAFSTDKALVTIPGMQRTAPEFAPVGALTPRVAFYVPLEDNSEPVGIFFVLRHLDKLAVTLTRARTLTTGESYLFDNDGLLMSPSRFEKELLDWRVATPPAVKDGIAVVHMRDPGRRLSVEPPRPGEDPASWERTLVLRTVLAARDTGDPAKFHGLISRPYRDYRGEPVVAAWRWLPELGLGIATESDAEEVLATARLVDRALLALLALIGLCTLWAVTSSGWLFRLSRQAAHRNEMGPYSLIEKIGEGGMGEVYLARHSLLKRNAAVKLLRRDRDNEFGFRQFEREAQLVSQLRHPNTVDLYDFGVAKDGTLYFVMEYLPGLNLAEWVKRGGRMPLSRSIHVVRQVANALLEAHQQGLLHCDVKPNNIMLCSLGGARDVVKLLDFGLAHSMRGAVHAAGTENGGTPHYTAPERLRGETELDARCDIYSLGVVWFYLLTAKLPHGASAVHWTEATLNNDPPPPSSFTAVDPEADQLIRSCMSRDPGDRPESVQALLVGINSLAARFPWTEQDAGECWQVVESAAVAGA